MSREKAPVIHFTDAGRDLLSTPGPIQRVVERFWEAERPEDQLGGRSIGAGRFSIVNQVGDAAIKVSSPTSSEDYNEVDWSAPDAPTKPFPAEDLITQYRVQAGLRAHLLDRGSDIIVPEPYFAARSDNGSYMFAQQYMEDWVPMSHWADERFDSPADPLFRMVHDGVQGRIQDAVADSPYEHALDDLHLYDTKLHLGNLLVPREAEIDYALPVCIIDQSGHDVPMPEIAPDMSQ